MSSWLSEDLNEREEISPGAARLNGWSLTSTGNQHRLSLLVNVGKFINAKTDDDDVHMNILGYYVDAV